MASSRTNAGFAFPFSSRMPCSRGLPRTPGSPSGMRSDVQRVSDPATCSARALDPLSPPSDVDAARREIEEAAFRRERLQIAGARLRERLTEVQAQEEDARRLLGYDKARAERDRLAAELRALYPNVAAQLT